MRNRPVSSQPPHEEIVLEHAQKTEPPSQGTRARVPKPDPGQGFGIGREKNAPVPSRPPPEGKAAPFQRCLRPAKANGCLLDPPGVAPRGYRKEIATRLERNPVGGGSPEKAARADSPALRAPPTPRVGRNPPVAGMLESGPEAEIVPSGRAPSQETPHAGGPGRAGP